MKKQEMVIYIAGKSTLDERNRIRVFAEQLTERGCRIAFNWFDYSPGDDGLSEKELFTQDVEAVRNCTCFILVFSEQPNEMIGAYVELGIAVSSSRCTRIIAVGSPPDPNVMLQCIDKVYANEQQVLDEEFTDLKLKFMQTRIMKQTGDE